MFSLRYQGLRGFGESVASSLGGSTSSSPNTAGTSLPGTGSYQGHNSGTTSNEGFKPGIITIVDLMVNLSIILATISKIEINWKQCIIYLTKNK